jgi:hypothetical protein
VMRWLRDSGNGNAWGLLYAGRSKQENTSDVSLRAKRRHSGQGLTFIM